jgi:murein DD-endopeptidase MepM/ murein hydrolase activator NlpD
MTKIKLIITRIMQNQRVKKFLSNQYAVHISVLVSVTIFVLIFSHVLNIFQVQAAMIKEHELAIRCYEIYFDEQYIGSIRDKQNFNEILEGFKESLKEQSHAEISITNQIEFLEGHAEDAEISTQDEIVARIKSQIQYNLLAYGIKVDGKMMGELRTLDEAESLLNDIRAPYESQLENSEIISLDFAEEVEIVQVEVSEYDIDNYEQLLAFLQKGTTEERIHVVESGDNLWIIADQYHLTVDELISANPTVDPVLIHPGDELSLIIPKPFIGVQTVELATLEENIPFDTEYEYVSWLYNDEYSTKIKGEYGIKEVEAKIVKENGLEVAREVLSEEVVEEPITRVVYNGTQTPPPKKGTGSFINPLPAGYVTSRYGSRWGGFHYGIDIGAKTGTAIKAADGGEVIYAGWFGDYGYMVEIDHGGGFTTRYGHCSQIYVSVGEKVYQGKTIAAVGSTGYSTGPHVHFEVRKYGSPVNPDYYIGTQYR